MIVTLVAVAEPEPSATYVLGLVSPGIAIAAGVVVAVAVVGVGAYYLYDHYQGEEKQARGVAGVPAMAPPEIPVPVPVPGIEFPSTQQPRSPVGDSRRSPLPEMQPQRERGHLSLRKKWQEHHEKPWPRDPETGWNQDVSHKVPVSEGGTNEVWNYDPQLHDEHMKDHLEKGDFRRWGKLGARKKKENQVTTCSGSEGGFAKCR